MLQEHTQCYKLAATAKLAAAAAHVQWPITYIHEITILCASKNGINMNMSDPVLGKAPGDAVDAARNFRHSRSCLGDWA